MEGYPYEETVKDRRSAACRRNGYGDAHRLYRWRQQQQSERGHNDTEAEVLSKYSTSTASVDNNKELKAKAEKFLNEKLDVSGSIFGYKYVLGYRAEGKTENAEFLTVLVAANVTYKDTLLGVILDEISRKINTDTNVNINQDGNWTKIGVVVKTDINTKQSYMAIAFQIKNPNYHK